MMKALLALAALSAAVFAVNADALQINGDFKGSKLDAEQPAGWVKNFKKFDDIAKSAIIAGEKEGTFAISVKATTRSTPFYTGRSFPANAGDQILIKADVKGTGTIQLGYYAYNENDQYISGKFSKHLSVRAGGKVESKIPITAVKSNRGEIKRVRIVFQVMKNAEVVLSNVEAEVIPAAPAN